MSMTDDQVIEFENALKKMQGEAAMLGAIVGANVADTEYTPQDGPSGIVVGAYAAFNDALRVLKRFQ